MRLIVHGSQRLFPRLFWAKSRSLATSTQSLRAATDKPKPKKTVVKFSALPKSSNLKPLEPWDDRQYPRSRLPEILKSRASSQSAIAADKVDGQKKCTEEEDLLDAIATGVIPDTPLSREVFINWKRFPDCILLTRVGSFYESYFEPARQISSILSINLTEKKYGSGNYPFAGFPVTALDRYLKILVQDLGHTVVLVEEYDSEGSIAHVGKKLTGGPGLKVRRVSRVITPGTMGDAGWLDTNESRYLLAVAVGKEKEDGRSEISLAYTDPSTGEFFTKDTIASQMEDELTRIVPREVVIDRSLKETWEKHTGNSKSPTDHAGDVVDMLGLFEVLGVRVSFADPHRPPPLWTSESSLSFTPITTEDHAISLIRHHLQYTFRETMPTLSHPNKQVNSAFMQIDSATLQALEIRHALRPGGLVATGEVRSMASPLSSRGTLLSVISKTVTSSGNRLLIRTLTAPSTSLPTINSRLALVQSFVDREDLRVELRDELKGIGDVMRIIQRCRGQRASGRDIWEIGKWIRSVQRISGTVQREIDLETGKSYSAEKAGGHERLQKLVNSFNHLSSLAEKIETSVDEEAIMFRSGNDRDDADGYESAGEELVKETPKSKETEIEKRERTRREREEREKAEWWILPSFHSELQARHAALATMKSEAQDLQISLSKEYKAPSLTVEKTGRLGYIIQVSKEEGGPASKTTSFQRVGAMSGKMMSFVYGPLTALGTSIEIATELLGIAQRRASRDLQNIIVDFAGSIQENADLVDELDLSMGFAQNAVEMNWVRPVLDDSTNLNIVAGRHPSVESSLLSASRMFTPNPTLMTPSTHLHVITGPNQGGKSTLLRQTAVIAILAQSGSFVPADRAEIGIVDRVFSRVGARDDLWRDRSTFMLEMVETAGILKHATNKSLVIMDEIGRGTTLHAGISIAYATLDHILRNIKCRTLFATHYHELGKMLGYKGDGADGKESRGTEGTAFWCTDVDELDGTFSYSYRLRPGVNYKSHAIKAARLAGMPETFLRIAEETLETLQSTTKKNGE